MVTPYVLTLMDAWVEARLRRLFENNRLTRCAAREVQQQSAATASPDIDLIRPPSSSDLHQRPRPTTVRLVRIEEDHRPGLLMTSTRLSGPWRPKDDLDDGGRRRC